MPGEVSCGQSLEWDLQATGLLYLCRTILCDIFVLEKYFAISTCFFLACKREGNSLSPPVFYFRQRGSDSGRDRGVVFRAVP